MILSIESAILQSLIIGLVYNERKKTDSVLVAQSQYTSIKPRKHSREVKVKSASADHETFNSDYDEGVPDVDEVEMIRSKENFHQTEVRLRLIAFQKILKQIDVHQTCLANLLTQMPENVLDRGCESMRGRINLDDCFDCLSEGQRPRRHSWHDGCPIPGVVIDPVFERKVDHLVQTNQDELLDNCYCDVKAVRSPKKIAKPKLVSRRTQTYLRDLLQLDAFEQNNDSDLSVILDDDADIDPTFCQQIFCKVIDNVSGNEQESDFKEQHESDSEQRLSTQDHHPRVDFELSEIQGDFDIDDLGNFVVHRLNGELVDKIGRKVNRRGYLLD